MRCGTPIPYSGDFSLIADGIPDYESAGLDMAFVAEAYTFDAVSQLGFLAARTTTLGLASGILNIFSRTPTTLAMTAAGLDNVSGGRFTLGIGASGPQVIEGFHGVPYGEPLGRAREVAQICRAVWRREPVVHDGANYQLPLGPSRGGSGLGKPLKLINTPVRERIPITLAAIGPRNVALAAELFEAWQPLFYFPESAHLAFGASLAAGSALRDPALGTLQVFADARLAITENRAEQETAEQQVRQHLALYIGGMGARGHNYYNSLAARYGFPDEAARVQELYLSGQRQAAERALPDEFVRGVSLVGPASHVAERVAAFAAAGVTLINATPLADGHRAKVAQIETLAGLLP